MTKLRGQGRLYGPGLIGFCGRGTIVLCVLLVVARILANGQSLLAAPLYCAFGSTTVLVFPPCPATRWEASV